MEATKSPAALDVKMLRTWVKQADEKTLETIKDLLQKELERRGSKKRSAGKPR